MVCCLFLVFCTFLPVFFWSSTTLFQMAATKRNSGKDPSRFVDKWVKLPASFWGKEWALETFGADYEKKFDVVKLHAFKQGNRANAPAFLFKLNNNEEFHLPLKELLAFDKQGLVTGTIFGFVLSGARKNTFWWFFGSGQPKQARKQTRVQKAVQKKNTSLPRAQYWYGIVDIIRVVVVLKSEECCWGVLCSFGLTLTTLFLTHFFVVVHHFTRKKANNHSKHLYKPAKT
jgi:hypothetical protein